MRLACLFLLLIVSVACKKPSENLVEYEPTPYHLEYPSYFGKIDSVQARLSRNPLTVEGIELGRRLFYDKLLSENQTISCASCHQQQFAFSDTARLSSGTVGQHGKRNSMSAANMLWPDRYFWDGRAPTLEDQVLFPIQDPLEMNLKLDVLIERLNASDSYREMFRKAFRTPGINSDRIAKALAQFVYTLVSQDSKYDLYKKGLYTPTASELNGMRLFATHPIPGQLRGGNCGDCHSEPLFDGKGFKNNGLDDNFSDIGYENVTNNPFDKGKFKIVSLRNVALTAPYMHDGRFKTLEEVLDHYNEHIKVTQYTDPLILEASNIEGIAPILALTAQEKKDIINFLHMLTDTVFIKNPKFSDPN